VRVRYNPAERQAIVTAGVRAFCLAGQDLPAEAMADLFLDHLAAIDRLLVGPGELEACA
jgi:hypothetical protein